MHKLKIRTLELEISPTNFDEHLSIDVENYIINLSVLEMIELHGFLQVHIAETFYELLKEKYE